MGDLAAYKSIQLEQALKELERVRTRLDAERERAEAWKRVAEEFGVCKCQVDGYGYGEQGCHDCLGTGFDHGEDPREVLKQTCVRLSKYEVVPANGWYPGSPRHEPEDVI